MSRYDSIWHDDQLLSLTDDSSGGSPIVVINSVDMLSRLTFPIKTEWIISIVAVSGKLELEVDLETRCLTADTMMVLGPGHTIGGFAASPDFKGFSVTATMGLLARALPYMSHIVVCFMRYRTNPVISITRDEAVTQMMLNDLLQRKLNQQGDSYSPMVAKRLLEAILYETLGIYAHHLDTPLAGRYKRGEELFCRFLTLVERSYKSERSIAFYADRLCVTPKHLSAVVKDASGRTAGEWIDSYVILEARTMLSSTDHTIQQISSDLNFPNQSFFGKYFKHHTGVSPREYRKNHSQE